MLRLWWDSLRYQAKLLPQRSLKLLLELIAWRRHDEPWWLQVGG